MLRLKDPHFLIEALLVLVLFVSAWRAWRWPTLGRSVINRAAARFAALAARPRAALMAAFGSALVIALVLSVARPTVPSVNDEYSYLLAARTYAAGRLANPEHPQWPHFETTHVLVTPVYMSKYPPGQGLALALGIVLTGHALAGIWLVFALAIASTCWMLRAYLPAPYALAMSLAAALRLGILEDPARVYFGYWARSRWGGAPALLGGTLVLGAAVRLAERPRAREAFLLALGLLVLANTRPYEGLLLSVPTLLVVAVGWLRHHRARLRTLLGSAAPALLVLALGSAAMAGYNRHLTGDPMTMPYQLYNRLYERLPYFTWQPPRPAPEARHAYLVEFRERRLRAYEVQRTLSGFLRTASRSAIRCFTFHLGPALLPGFLLALPLLWRSRRLLWPAVALALVYLGDFAVTTGVFHPHYPAPAAPVLFLLAGAGLERLARARPPAGRTLAALLLGLVLASFIAGVLRLALTPLPDHWGMRRAAIERDLVAQGGRHLVFVRYGPNHRMAEEWVANGPDIDAGKVIWAQAMGDAADRRLLAHAPARKTWLLDTGTVPEALTPYPGER